MQPCRIRSLVLALIASLLALAASAALAEEAISVTVDATKTQQKLLHVHLVMPVRPGPLTVYYPKWIPGEHGPDGPITNLTGLKFEADGKIIPWQRDLLDVFTFHVEIPRGVSHLDVNYDYIEPDGVSATDKLMVLEWNEVVLYPADIPAEKLTYEAKLVMPEGWKFGTSLPVKMQPAIRFHSNRSHWTACGFAGNHRRVLSRASTSPREENPSITNSTWLPIARRAEH